MVTSVALIRPRVSRAGFADVLAAWLREGLRTRPVAGPAAVVIVPEYLRAAPRTVLADLTDRDWRGTTVALAGYGGRTRGRHAVDDARAALTEHGTTVLGPSLGIDVARTRVRGFDTADVLLRDLVLDAVADAADRAAA
ncbi:hypothetical protein WCD74_21750 [Actinomycetospora sp. OC33-EN08]|uniref:Uncharacterized protein n=1 Tax=Actinomycetospora aurantiaca TaxID=3129233 RepID=A0ABU8MSW1_9PSEU